MTSFRSHGVRAAAAFTALTALLTACSTGAASADGGRQFGDCTAAANKPVSLVLGARMDSERPYLPAVGDLLSTAVENQQAIQLFRVDGQPSRAVKVSPVINGKNPAQRKDEVAAAVRQVTNAITGLAPRKPEADDLTALSEAAKLTDDGGTIVLMDSGLATAGAVSYLNDGMFDADPGDVANFLASKQLLPALQNKVVVLAGLGLTADPQPALDENLQKRVTALWQAVVAKAGAKCTAVVQIPTRHDAVKADQPVSVVKLPAPIRFTPCGNTVLADSGAVGFQPDRAILRDVTAARNTLNGLVAQLTGGTQKVNLVGNTATHGSPQGSLTLSKQRADAVKALLVQAGIAADRITTEGDGQTGRYHRPDIGPDGTLDPIVAAQNRSVVVELSCAR